VSFETLTGALGYRLDDWGFASR